MDKKVEQKIAEIDGYKNIGGCYVATPADGLVDLPDFDDDAVMFGVINRWAAGGGDGSADASERTLVHNYDGHNHQISLRCVTHVFDDSVGQGESFDALALCENYAESAQRALIQVEGLYYE